MIQIDMRPSRLPAGRSSFDRCQTGENMSKQVSYTTLRSVAALRVTGFSQPGRDVYVTGGYPLLVSRAMGIPTATRQLEYPT